MGNMEDYSDASAMAAPGTHQLSAGLEIIALHKKKLFRPRYAQAPLHYVCDCAYVCVCVCD